MNGNGRIYRPGQVNVNVLVNRMTEFPLAHPVVALSPAGNDIMANVLGGMTPLQAIFCQVAAQMTPAVVNAGDSDEAGKALLAVAESWSLSIEARCREIGAKERAAAESAAAEVKAKLDQ